MKAIKMRAKSTKRVADVSATKQVDKLNIDSRRFELEQAGLVELAKRAEWCTGD
jgi:hypothetical protein